MSTGFELVAEARAELGKAAVRRLRKNNKVPAVVYGAGSEPVSITLAQDKLQHSLENEAFFSHILSIDIDGKTEKAVLKDLQRHPSKPVIMHADFLRVMMDEEIRLHVPLHFLGEDVAPGVKAGGVVTHHMVDVEVACLPGALPEFISVDISGLEIGDSLHLTDIQLPEGVVLPVLAQGEDHDHQVVSVQANRVTVEDEEGADEAAEGEEASAEGGESDGE